MHPTGAAKHPNRPTSRARNGHDGSSYNSVVSGIQRAPGIPFRAGAWCVSGPNRERQRAGRRVQLARGTPSGTGQRGVAVPEAELLDHRHPEAAAAGPPAPPAPVVRAAAGPGAEDDPGDAVQPAGATAGQRPVDAGRGALRSPRTPPGQRAARGYGGWRALGRRWSRWSRRNTVRAAAARCRAESGHGETAARAHARRARRHAAGHARGEGADCLRREEGDAAVGARGHSPRWARGRRPGGCGGAGLGEAHPVERMPCSTSDR